MNSTEGSQKKILVIDDDPDFLEFLKTLLVDNGYAVVGATDGQQGVDQARKENPDLISLDITMPEKSGVGSYRDLKTDPELAKIPVIIVTGVSDDFKDYISRRKQVPPPEGYIAKPIEEAEYLGTIAELLKPGSF